MLDRWDIIGASGVMIFCTGFAFVYWPVAVILFGASLVAAYALREYSSGTSAPRDSDETDGSRLDD